VFVCTTTYTFVSTTRYVKGFTVSNRNRFHLFRFAPFGLPRITVLSQDGFPLQARGELGHVRSD
jgi:hypothetical protein